MFTKTVFAAAAVATAIAATPVTSANAQPPQINFSIGFQTPDGYFSFGTGPGGGFDPQPTSMSCWEARDYLKAEFKKVQKVECNGSVYTFQVKKFNFGQWKTVKLNKSNGQYWFV